PAATLTNVGLFGNGRFYQGLLTKLYSDALPESNRRAAEAHAELNKIIPKFVKRAKRDEYAIATERKMQQFAADLLRNTPPRKEEYCVLLPMAKDPKELQDGVLALALYRYSSHPLRQLLDIVRQMSHEKRAELMKTYTGERKTRRERPRRAF